MDGYLVGGMPPPWVEWNDQYRDEIRDFWRNHNQRHARRRDPAGRLLGPVRRRRPLGVRLDQLRHRPRRLHRARPGQLRAQAQRGQRRGATATAPTTTARGTTASRARATTPRSLAVRRRQAANIMATLCLSNGVPMITAGDERGRTQRGNNNAYCQDNEISYVDWRPDDAWLDVYEVTRTALALRREHPALRQRHWFEGRPTIRGGPKDLAWLHPTGREMTPRGLARPRACARSACSSPAPPLRAPGPRGEQQVDSSFMVWFSSGWLPQRVAAARERLGAARRGGALDRRAAAGGDGGRGRRRPHRGSTQRRGAAQHRSLNHLEPVVPLSVGRGSR